MLNNAPARNPSADDQWLGELLRVVGMPLVIAKPYWEQRYKDGFIPSARFVRLMWAPPLAVAILVSLGWALFDPAWWALGKSWYLEQFSASPMDTVIASVAAYCVAGAGLSFALGTAFVVQDIERRTTLHDLDNVHGDARFMTARDVKLRPVSKLAVPMGKLAVPESPELLHDGHNLVVAPTRTGKGASVIIPTLLTYDGNILVFDPKGYSHAITARRRRELGQEVRIIDPFGMTDAVSDALNIFDLIDLNSVDCVQEANTIASILQPVSDGKNVFFEQNAQYLGASLTLLTKAQGNLKHEAEQCRFFRKLTVRGKAEVLAALETRKKWGEEAEFALDNFAGWLKNQDDEQLPSFFSTLAASTTFLEVPQFREVMARSSLSLKDLRDKPTTFYLVIPEHRFEIARKYLRLFMRLTYNSVVEHQWDGKSKWLWLVDEANVLGNFDLLPQILDIGAERGIALWTFFQHFGQIKKNYQTLDIFEANAAMMVFGVNDLHAAKFVSEKMGTTTIRTHSVSLSRAAKTQAASASSSEAQQQRPLMFQDEVARLPLSRALFLPPGGRPALLRKEFYFDNARLRKLADPHPIFG